VSRPSRQGYRADICRIPDDYPLDVAALVEPLAVGWNAVSLTDFKPDETALVTGAGPIGLAVLLSLKARDHHARVFVSAPKSSRSELAITYGAEAVFDPKEVDVVEAVKAATNGDGVHVAYECAGVGSALPIAVQSVRSGGTIVNASVYIKGEPVTMDPNLLTRFGRIYKGAMGYYPGCFAEVVEALVSGR
jgi:threonine dehydrogenase-like Zn-dependent dehydrogenase